MKPLALVALLVAAQTNSPVKLVKAKPISSSAREQLTGQFFPNKLLPLGFEVGGRLKNVNVKKGDTVKEGQVVGRLDPEIIDAQVAQAEAGVAAAEAAATLAVDVAQRQEKLKAEGSISDVQSKNALTQSVPSCGKLCVVKFAICLVPITSLITPKKILPKAARPMT